MASVPLQVDTADLILEAVESISTAELSKGAPLLFLYAGKSGGMRRGSGPDAQRTVISCRGLHVLVLDRDMHRGFRRRITKNQTENNTIE